MVYAKYKYITLVFAGQLLTGWSFARTDAAEVKPPTIRIDSGLISGSTLTSASNDKEVVDIYGGIPFAAAPIGGLRWKPPQPVKRWKEVRVCTDFGPACPQPKVPIISDDINHLDEDCLNLNVWAPAKHIAKGYPVMVWIHGGAYVLGANCQRLYDGEQLARKGVVVVTINYRLGPFGFMAHPLLSKESEHGVSGNYGLLDQIAALAWVQRNIAAFGGDPGCVTIFGESAGAGSVCHLLVSPLAKGLFHRAIAESGAARDLKRHLREKRYGKEPMEAVGQFIAKTLKCDRSADPLAALRSKSAAAILDAANAAKRHFGEETAWPIVDGWVLPDDPAVLFQEGKAIDVPFLTGSNADEIGSFMSDAIIRVVYHERADDVLTLFTGDDRKHAGTVAIFTVAARADARDMSRHKSKAFLYQFTRVPPPLRFLGCFHSAEIGYVFGNFNPKFAGEPRDRELSQTIMSYWVNFARSGDPNGPDLPAWPAYDVRTDIHMELGDEVRTQTGLFKHACDGIDQINEERLRNRKSS